MVERVAELLALGAQICLVVGVGGVLDRELVAHRQPIAGQARDLLGIVGQDPDARQAEVDQDLGPDPVVAQVGREPET